MLKTLRDRGYKVAIYEAGNDIGGTWRWNCYPGAGVDSEVPEYEFSWREVWETWDWKSNYPTYQDLRAYFDHVDKIIGVKNDCSFNTVVVGASFDADTGKWSVRTEDGRVAKAKFLILGTGFVRVFYLSLAYQLLIYTRQQNAMSHNGLAWISSRELFTTHRSGLTRRSTLRTSAAQS